MAMQQKVRCMCGRYGMGWGGVVWSWAGARWEREREMAQNKKSGHGRTKWCDTCMPMIGVNSIMHVLHVPQLKSHVTIIL